MRKTKEQKAITLIALIITIVVLLILAVVAINAVTGDGIIQHATNARSEYQEAQTEEEGILSYYEQYLNTKNGSGPWKQEGNILYMTESNGEKIEVKIGDKVNYNAGKGRTSTIDSNFVMKEDMVWRVLGINKLGQLELISEKATDSTLTLGGEEGYLNAPQRLNALCNDIYGKGEGAYKARSLNKDDINKIAGIDTEEEKSALDEGYGYGVWYRYSYNSTSGKIESSKSLNYNPETKEGTWSSPITTADAVFKQPGKKQIDSSNSNDIAEIRCTYYRYKLSDQIPETLKAFDGKLISEIIAGNDVYTSDNELVAQWLGSCREFCVDQGVQFEIDALGKGWVDGMLVKTTSHANYPDGWNKSYRVRPVIVLKSDVILEKVNGIWEIKN